ncbi:AraC family transcriptional regulator [Actinoplanes sp. NPDC051633]|uniref:AraC family transcriptional regulator n=1 Tax=Actinoplanes sp. NPDC051633 TaxID=3155670 RepID=UPI00342D0DE7
MDALSHVLTGPAARDAFVLRSSLDPPWAMRIEDESPLSVITLLRGQAYIRPDDADPVLLRAGDVAIASGPRHYTVGDDPATAPQVLIGRGQTCTMLTADVPKMSDVGVRTWGNSVDGATLMLNGTYETQSTVGRRLLGNLPGLIVAPREHVPLALIDYLGEQVTNDAPGQDAVLDRMLDLILIAVLRWWFADRQRGASWFRAYADPAIGRALRLMQEDPAAPWTVARLGGETGLSRAAFARRFTELVGEPPMSFLTGWRLSLAADLLAEPGTTVAAVARKVGYATPFAFSTAFKRFHTVSPQQHREQSYPQGDLVAVDRG